jgi:hypothetical protein
VVRPWWFHQPTSGFRRIACTEPCQIGGEESGRPGTVWNVSVLGLYVVMEEPLPAVGDILSIRFCLPQDPRPIRSSARVAWQNPASIFKGLGAAAVGLPPGCGWAFVEMSAEDRERIDSRVRATRLPF